MHVLAATLHYFYVRNEQKYTPKVEYFVPFFQNFLEEIYMPYIYRPRAFSTTPTKRDVQ